MIKKQQLHDTIDYIPAFNVLALNFGPKVGDSTRGIFVSRPRARFDPMNNIQMNRQTPAHITAKFTPGGKRSSSDFWENRFVSRTGIFSPGDHLADFSLIVRAG